MMRSPGLDSTRLVQRARAAAGEYWTYVRQFSPGARLFLAAATLGGLNSGVQSVLLNLYVLSLGYGEAFLGQMLRYGPLAALPAALAAGPLVDTFGPKRAILAGIALAGAGAITLLASPAPPILKLGLAVASAGAVIVYIAANPFMARHSTPRERTHLFVVAAAAFVVSTAAGSALGGQLPSIIRALAASGGWSLSQAGIYRLSLLAGALLSAIGVPLIVLVREPDDPLLLSSSAGRRASAWAGRGVASLRLLKELIGSRRVLTLVGQLIFTDALIRVGGNLVVPYFNVLFVRYLGASEAWYGWLRFVERAVQVVATLLVAPLALRYGPISTIAVTQLLSVPMLLALGFAPSLGFASLAFLFRGTLMDMTIPVRDAFVMNVVPARLRATVNALLLLAGQAIAFVVIPHGGALMQNGQLWLAYSLTALLYVASAILYWRFFAAHPEAAPGGRLRLELAAGTAAADG